MSPGVVRWRAFGGSVRGHGHALRGLPNEDAIRLDHPELGAPPVIASVADGHGDALHFRSGIGAQMAVDAACETLAGAPSGGLEQHAPGLALQMVEVWRSKTSTHLLANPFSSSEIAEALENTRADPVDFSVQPLVAYGATLLAVLIRSNDALHFQLGDGDMLIVNADGLTERVFPAASGDLGEATYSLCLDDAASLFQMRWFDHGARSALQMVLLSTDGYAKSFRTEEDFLKIGSDYLALIVRDGVTAVMRDLPRVLSHTSEAGSGDDITLAVVVRVRGGDEHQDVTPFAAKNFLSGERGRRPGPSWAKWSQLLRRRR